MKTLFYTKIVTLVLIASFFSPSGNAQASKGADEIPHDISYYRTSMVSKPLVKVIYGRPSKNGEAVFGNKVAYGEIWRTGANEATEVKFYEDITLGGQKIAAGTYVLYTIPGEKEWEIILSSNLDVLGAFQYDPIFDVARVTVKANSAEELEAFSIFFREKQDSIQMVLGWDTTRVNIPITLPASKEYAKI